MAQVIQCNSSGRSYEVEFDKEGLVVGVWNTRGGVRRRRTWHYTDSKAMGLTAACAVRCAQRAAVERKIDLPNPRAPR